MTTTSELFDRATILVPSGLPGEAPMLIPACFRGRENRRLHLSTRERLASSTAVSVEYDDVMFLGEVIACSQDLDDRWHLEIEVEQILTGLQSLLNLRARLLGESVRAGAPERLPAAAAR